MLKPIVVLVFGGNGWIGSKVVKLLQNSNTTVIKSSCRADDINAIQKEITDIGNVTHIMSFIGRTHGTYNNEVIGTIDYLEKPGKLVDNMRDNLFSPIGLAELSKKNNIHFTYLGTGCIFEYDNEHLFGDQESGFLEADLPNFFGSSYSIVKGYTDRLMQLLYSDSTLNARIRMPITDEQDSPRNFITKITSYKKVCSIPNSMSVLDELLPVLIEAAFCPPGVHVKLNGAPFPPEGVTVAPPLHRPKQVILCDVAVILSAGGCVIFTMAVVEQPTASVTEIV